MRFVPTPVRVNNWSFCRSIFLAGGIWLTAVPAFSRETPSTAPASGDATAPAAATSDSGDSATSSNRNGAVAPTPPAPAPPAVVRPNPTGVAPVRLTLTDALNLSLDENPGVGAVAERIARARARVREVGAAVQPQLSATGTITRQGPISTVTFPGQNGQPGQTITLGSPTTKTVALNAVKSLDLSGQNRVSRDIARRGITSSELDLARAQNDLLLSVSNAYYDVLRSDQFVTVAEDAVAAAQEQLRVADVSYREGALAQFDVTRAAVQVENLRQDLVTAQRNASVARATLLNVLGIDPATPVELSPVDLPAPISPPENLLPPAPVPETGAGAPGPAGENPAAPGAGTLDNAPPEDNAPDAAAPAPPDAATPPLTPESAVTPTLPPIAPTPDVTVATDLPLDLTTALDQAYTARPEVQNAANQVRIAERNIDLARRGRRPDVNLTGQYLFSPDVAGFSSNKQSWNVAAQLSVPIFEGGLTRARVDEARSDLAASQQTLEQTKQSVGLEVRTALLNLQEAGRRRETAAANVVQAREALRIAQVRFRAGVSTTVEVTDAQVAFTRAQTNQVNADFDFLSAEASLRRAVGRLVPEATRTQVQNPPGPPPPTPNIRVGNSGTTPRPADRGTSTSEPPSNPGGGSNRNTAPSGPAAPPAGTSPSGDAVNPVDSRPPTDNSQTSPAQPGQEEQQ